MRSYYETNACYAGRHTGQRKVKDPDQLWNHFLPDCRRLHFYLLYGCSWTNFRTSHYRFLRSDRNFRTRCSSTGIQSESHNWITALFWIHTRRHRSWFWTDQYFRYRNSPGRHCYPKHYYAPEHRYSPTGSVCHTSPYPVRHISTKDCRRWDQTDRRDRWDCTKPCCCPGIHCCTWWFSAWLHRPKLLCKVQRLYQKCSFQWNLCDLARKYYPCKCTCYYVIYP